MSTQVCKKCGVEKPVSNFGKSTCRTLADGTKKQYYRTTCKQCINTPLKRIDNLDPKVCNKCGVSKPLAEYHYEKGRDRYRGECRQCRSNWRNAHRPKIAERLNAKSRNRWANEPGYAEKQRETNKKSREKHKDRRNAEKRELYANDLEYRENLLQERRDLWANNSEYKERCKERNKLYHQEHKEELSIKKQKYAEENKDKIRERQKKYREENPEHMKKLRKAQYEKHQEKLVEEQKRIRYERRQYLREYLGGKCVRCGATEKLDFDHIIPADKSYTIGSNITCFSLEELILEVDKCQLLCRPCHIQKGRESGDFTGPKGLPEEVKAKRIRR
tara:strand:+ start:885 stop:1880 length:996 start_codon:yes stop_codon:yes gene_type:complete